MKYPPFLQAATIEALAVCYNYKHCEKYHKLVSTIYNYMDVFSAVTH